MKVKRTHSFNPYDFKEETSELTNAEEHMLTKQKRVLKFDIGLFGKLCEKFRNKHQLRIQDLSGNDKEDFNMMVSYVHLLYPTKEYKYLYKKVLKWFGDLEYIEPGTVGGYFGGCLVKTDWTKKGTPGCSVACAGSVPKPLDEEGWSFCDKAVILAEWDNNRYNFSMLKESVTNDMSTCYLFIDCLDLHEFKGFAANELDELDLMGCLNIILVGYDTDGKSYVDLYDHPVDVYNLKFRAKPEEPSYSSVLAALAFVIVALLILLILYFNYQDEE